MKKSAANVISGTTVVITGAGSGIGRALAQRLSAHSCPVAIADVDEGALKETEATLAGPTWNTWDESLSKSTSTSSIAAGSPLQPAPGTATKAGRMRSEPIAMWPTTGPARCRGPTPWSNA